MAEFNLGNSDLKRLGFTSSDKADYRMATRQRGFGLEEAQRMERVGKQRSGPFNRVSSLRKIINNTPSSRHLMRQVSGLGMEDPVFGTKEVGPTHPSNIFDDMSISDIPEDMRDMVSIASDPTATMNDGLDVRMFQQNMAHLHSSLTDFDVSIPEAIPISPRSKSSSPSYSPETQDNPVVMTATSKTAAVTPKAKPIMPRPKPKLSCSKDKHATSPRKVKHTTTATSKVPIKSPAPPTKRSVKRPDLSVSHDDDVSICLEEAFRPQQQVALLAAPAPPVASPTPTPLQPQFPHFSKQSRAARPRRASMHGGVPSRPQQHKSMHDSVHKLVDNILTGAAHSLKKDGAVSQELYEKALSQSMSEFNGDDLGVAKPPPVRARRRNSMHNTPRSMNMAVHKPVQVQELMNGPKVEKHRVMPSMMSLFPPIAPAVATKVDRSKKQRTKASRRQSADTTTSSSSSSSSLLRRSHHRNPLKSNGRSNAKVSVVV